MSSTNDLRAVWNEISRSKDELDKHISNSKIIATAIEEELTKFKRRAGQWMEKEEERINELDKFKISYDNVKTSQKDLREARSERDKAQQAGDEARAKLADLTGEK